LTYVARYHPVGGQEIGDKEIANIYYINFKKTFAGRDRPGVHWQFYSDEKQKQARNCLFKAQEVAQSEKPRLAVYAAFLISIMGRCFLPSR